MLNKDEWIANFERKYGRKPRPKEFVEGKKSGEFSSYERSAIESSIVSDSEDPIFVGKQDFVDKKQFVAPIDSRSTKQNSYHQSSPVMFCYNCGKEIQADIYQCQSCGVSLYRKHDSVSFLSNLTSKLSEVSAIATQKTREMSHRQQINSDRISEEQNRDNLFLALGKAYFDKYSTQVDVEFQELVNEIKRSNSIIQGQESADSDNTV